MKSESNSARLMADGYKEKATMSRPILKLPGISVFNAFCPVFNYLTLVLLLKSFVPL